MSVPQWQPGTLYQPGALVRPLTTPAVQSGNVANYDFEFGDSGYWVKGTGFAIDTLINPAFGGVYTLRFSNTASNIHAYATDEKNINPGTTINASCRVYLTPDASGHAGGRVMLEWLDGSSNVLQRDLGNVFFNEAPNVWYQSVVTATAPAGAVKVRIGCEATRTSGVGIVGFDQFVWDWTYTPPGASAGLVYKATQTNAATSGTAEPTWPAYSSTVVDGGVTWEGVYANRVTWTASPILESGTTEPTWPTTVGGQVMDGSMAWEADTGRITDSKCPNSKVVAIVASKVFAGDDDIMAYSATVNPLDWSSPNDAGYLPFGLNTHGATPIRAAGLYRGNLVIFNEEGYQMWQVDEDPANNAILDAQPIDCPYHRSVQSVANDLILLTAQGVRSLGIAGASTNIQAGFFGAQIDPLVLEAIKALPEGEQPISLFWPGAGQYWLIFGAEAFVLTMNGGPKDQSWSRYVFPDEITDWAILDSELYLRSGELVWRVSDDAIYDDQLEDTTTGGENVEFVGKVWWPYLDIGAIGVDKQLEAFDLVITGECNVQFGYNQTNMSLVTDPYTVDGDTLVGMPIPMPLQAPSLQLRLTFSAAQNWEWSASKLYVNYS